MAPAPGAAGGCPATRTQSISCHMVCSSGLASSACVQSRQLPGLARPELEASGGRLATHEDLHTLFRPGLHDVAELIDGLPAMVLAIPRVSLVELRVPSEAWMPHHHDMADARASAVARKAHVGVS